MSKPTLAAPSCATSSGTAGTDLLEGSARGAGRTLAAVTAGPPCEQVITVAPVWRAGREQEGRSVPFEGVTMAAAAALGPIPLVNGDPVPWRLDLDTPALRRCAAALLRCNGSSTAHRTTPTSSRHAGQRWPST